MLHFARLPLSLVICIFMSLSSLNVCLLPCLSFWSVAHLGEERGGSHRAICYFEGRPREDLNVNQLNFPAMVPPPNCEFGIVNKVRFKDYSPRGSIVNDAKL